MIDETITVNEVYKKKTNSGSDMYTIKYNGDKYFNVFDARLARILKIAQTKDIDLDVMFERNGEYLNLSKIVTQVADEDGVTIDSAPPKKSYSGGGKADPNKLKSIERQSALKQAVYLVTHGDASMDELEDLTDRLYNILIK